jgi:ABC-type transport system involved in multi-copper enzyme maturation permease subunit
VICLILLAAFAIVASSIALYGAVRFHSRAESIKEIVGRTAFEAAATIYNITGAIERMENTSRLYSNSSKAFDHLNSTVQTLNSEAVEIQEKAEKNMRLASKGINTLEAVTISTVTLNLVAVLALLGKLIIVKCF